MPSDPPTLFLVLVVSTFATTLLLLWCWWQNPSERSLLWIGSGYASASVGTLLYTGRGRIDDLLSIDLGTALILYGFGLSWIAARSFNGRPLHQWVPFVGVAVWLVACRFPVLHDSFPMRVIVTSVILAGYGWLAAWEFFARDGLKTRYPVAILFAVHAVIVALRIPLAIDDMGRAAAAFESPWFGPVALESIVFGQVIAFLIVTLTKERVELRLRDAALTDPLTGLANRRALFERGRETMRTAAREQRPTSVVVFDLDRFKEINDTFGHPVGDAVIKVFAAAAAETLRAGDHVGRIGGEEFAAILPGADTTAASVAARRIMDSFSARAATVEGCRSGCTVSAGIATAAASERSTEMLLAAADRALYEAKRRGGNRLEVAA